MHAVTGSWLIVKWLGLLILLTYVVLLLIALWQFRERWSRKRAWLVVPLILGSFLSLSVPSIFESVTFSRVCFVVAQVIYVVGIGALVSELARKDQEGLLRADG